MVKMRLSTEGWVRMSQFALISFIGNFRFASYVSDDVKYLIPKETRKLSDLNRTMIILSIAVPLLLLFFGIITSY